MRFPRLSLHEGRARPDTVPGGVVPDSDPGISQAHKDAGLKFDGSKALPANLVRPFPGLGGIRFEENVATSNFNSLQVAVNRRFSRGFSYSIAYTWSKAMGVAAGDGSFVNPFNVRLYDYRLLDFDRTHAFTATYIYDVPKLGRNWATTASLAPARRVADFRHHFADQRQSVRAWRWSRWRRQRQPAHHRLLD